MTCNCNGNCWRYGSCSATAPQMYYVTWGGVVAGHCGRCGAPYTWNPIAGSTASEYTPTCNCWNR